MKPYFCYLDHFATGEGIVFCLGLVAAESEEQAREKFVIENMLTHWNPETDATRIKEGVEYYSGGVLVYDFRDKSKRDDIKRILKDFISESHIEYILTADDNHALHRFRFHSYVNYS